MEELDIKEFIQTTLIPNYWESTKGRGVGHLNQVVRNARRLAGRDLTERELLTMALHDIGVGYRGFSRDQHNVGSIVAIHTERDLIPLRKVVDGEIECAVLCHMRDEYQASGILGPIHQLLIEADEGAPVWGHERIVKPVKYWLDGRGQPLSTPIKDVVGHILRVIRKKVEAFRSGKPPFTGRFVEVFSKEIETATAWAETVTGDDIREVIDELRG